MIDLPLPEGTYRMVQGFGSSPATYRQFNMAGHNGYDLAPLQPGMRGVVVCAPHEGYVSLNVEKNASGYYGYGNFVTIIGLPHDHEGNQHRSDLCHLASFLVENGQYVHMGDPIGVMGQTGFATGIHTHWTYKVMRDGQTLGKDNGYLGAIDIGRYARSWSPKTLV